MSLWTRAGFAKLVAGLPATSLVDQWESHVAKVGDKVFALLSEGGGQVVFRVEETSYEILIAQPGIGQPPYFAKRRWIMVAADAELTPADIKAYIAKAHKLVAAGLTKKRRAELGLPVD